MSAAATDGANRSYREVLRDRHVAGLLLGDLLASVGTGVIIVAMPVQTLSIHGSVPAAIAIGMVEAAPFVLSTVVALSIGLGRVRVPPRTLLIADCVLRSLTFTTLGALAVTQRLTLPVLILGLLVGSMFRIAGSSSRRVLATSMAGETGRFAVNGAALVTRLRNLPQRQVLIAIIGLWTVCPILLAFVDNLAVAMIVFGLGGLVWAPFTPVAFSFVQSGVEPHEQQQVVTLWTTVSIVAAPLGLVVGGPLVEFAGTSGGPVLSGALTMLLLPIASVAVLRTHAGTGQESRSAGHKPELT